MTLRSLWWDIHLYFGQHHSVMLTFSIISVCLCLCHPSHTHTHTHTHTHSRSYSHTLSVWVAFFFSKKTSFPHKAPNTTCGRETSHIKYLPATMECAKESVMCTFVMSDVKVLVWYRMTSVLQNVVVCCGMLHVMRWWYNTRCVGVIWNLVAWCGTVWYGM